MKRNNYFNLALSAVRIILREGWGGFLVRLKLWLNSIIPDPPVDRISDEATYYANYLDFSVEDLDLSKQSNGLYQGYLPVKSINWFLPDFDNPFGGGVRTILQFAKYYKETMGVKNRFVIPGNISREKIHGLIVKAFPALADQEVCILNSDEAFDKLEPADISIASLWLTAYFLLKFNKTKRKFYFIQDYEPAFYAAGSVYGQAEETYRFGFYGICNTISMKNIYENKYAGKAQFFIPCVDTNIFYPSGIKTEEKPYKIFFYGRPGQSTQRNAFALGAAALIKLKQRMGDSVHIFTAGANWDPGDYGLSGTIENLGILSYEETASLYRQCDLGLAMMFTPHPSYIPFELMACGCLSVCNINEGTTWFLRDKVNCILAHPSATAICQAIEQILNDPKERNRITSYALDMIKTNYSDWKKEMDKVYTYMCDPERSLG